MISGTSCQSVGEFANRFELGAGTDERKPAQILLSGTGSFVIVSIS
jgi:hypothetical protein